MEHAPVGTVAIHGDPLDADVDEEPIAAPDPEQPATGKEIEYRLAERDVAHRVGIADGDAERRPVLERHAHVDGAVAPELVDELAGDQVRHRDQVEAMPDPD